MILSEKNSLLEDIEAARKNGFTTDFWYRDGKITARDTSKNYTKEQCFLVEYCRHEGMNDPGDSSILFLISCDDGTKGCLSSAYGIDADVDLINFVMALKRLK
jgi:hypothetical protein